MLHEENSHSSAGRNGHSGNGHYNGELISASNHRTEPDDEIDLMKLLATLLRRKWTVVSITALGLVAAILFIMLSPPVYESSGTFLITESPNSIAAGRELQYCLDGRYGG